MKCILCNIKKSKRYCERTKTYICKKCCKESRNLSQCPSVCSHYPKETSNRTLISNVELMQNDNGKTILFANNCFLPNIFELLKIEINKLEIYILSHGIVRLRIDFIISENREKTSRDIDEKEAYLKDDWKRLDNGVEEKLVPIIQIYTNKDGKSELYANEYGIEDRISNSKKISNYLNTFMPFATNNLKEVVTKEQGMPEKLLANVCNGESFLGKNDTYYAELKLNKEYHFDFKIEYEKLVIKDNIITYPFGLFFPFQLVNVKNFKIQSIEEITISKNSLVHLVLPNKGEIANYNLVPLEGNENCFCGKIGASLKLEELEPPFHYDKYAINFFDLGFESKKELMCRCIYTNLPLQLGVYESLNSVYDKLYAPIKVAIVNNTDKIKKLEIFTIIENLCEELKQNETLLPKEYKLIPLCPNMNIEKKNSIMDVTNRTARTVVKEENNILIDETHEIKVYPKNLFVFSMENKEKNWKVSLVPHIARFVTPHNKCIDGIYTIATRKRALMGYLSNNRDMLIKDLESIYEAVSENFELEYATDSYWFGTDDYKKQNIKLPEEVIKTKCGNCIELSLLLASCFEKLALDTYIVLVPRHAFLGVQLFGTERLYIESTMLGKKKFEEAVFRGQKEYEEYFEGENPKVSGAQIINIKNSRKIGIYPIE